MSIVFDYARFYKDLDRVRRQRKVAWNKVATRTGVVPSGMHSFVRQFDGSGGAPKALSLETMLRLLHWMGKTDIATYMADEDSVNDE